MSIALDELRDKLKACQACGLCKTRTNVVFGVGDEGARVLFVGEAPGRDEDLSGEPFVGRGGKLLDKMLEAVGLSRHKNIFIANMIKCRPPDNRDPEQNEVAACIVNLYRQIEIINPLLIVCLGRIAAYEFISKDFKVTREHGSWHEKDGRLVMGTFHPAAILRDPSKKPEAFADFIAVRDKLLEACPEIFDQSYRDHLLKL